MKSLGFAKNVSVVMTRLAAGALLALFISSFLARTLGPEGNGAYALAVLLPLLAVSLGGLGIAPATVYFISGDRFSVPEVVAKNIFISFVAACATLMLAMPLLFAYGREWFADVPLQVLILALLMTFPLMFFGNLVAVFQGLQSYRLHGALTLLPQAITATLLVLCLQFFEYKLRVAVSIWGLGYVVALGMIGYYLRSALREFFKNLRTHSHYLSQSLKYGLKAHVGNFITLLNYRLDVYILGVLAGTQAVGIYAVTVPITEATWLISNSASFVIFPLVASLQSDASDNTTPFVSRWVFLATIACALIIAVLRHRIINLFFGVVFEEAEMPLLWLLPGVTVWAMARVLCNDIAGRGHPEINTIISLLALILNIISNILLIPIFGVTGAAMASSISYCFFAITVMFVYSHLTKAKLRDLIIPSRRDWPILGGMVRSLLSKVTTSRAVP